MEIIQISDLTGALNILWEHQFKFQQPFWETEIEYFVYSAKVFQMKPEKLWRLLAIFSEGMSSLPFQ